MLTNEFRIFVNNLITEIIKNRRIYKQYVINESEVNNQNKLKPPYKCYDIDYSYNLDKILCETKHLFKMDAYENYYYDNIKNDNVYGNEPFIFSDNYGADDDGYYNKWLQFNLVFVFLNKIVIATYLTNKYVEYTVVPFINKVEVEDNFQNFFRFFGDKRGYRIEYSEHKNEMCYINFRIKNYDKYCDQKIYNLLKKCFNKKCDKDNLWQISLKKDDVVKYIIKFAYKFDNKDLIELEQKEKLIQEYMQHVNNKKWYKIIDFCKIQIDNNWVDGIIYVSADDVDEEKQKFVRTVDEFLLKFY